MSVLILTEAELRQAVGFDPAALAAVEQAFVWLAQGRVSMPPIMHIAVPERHGDVDIKSAYVPGLEVMAVKIASGFFDNPALGLPTGTAMMVALSTQTGRPAAVLLDNGYLTDLRTALAGAVAARHLAGTAPQAVGVIGAGLQARYQVRALQLVREVAQVRVFARDAAQGKRYCAELRDTLGLDCQHLASVAQVLACSDLVITTTPARAPLIDLEDLHPGLHITAMGADLAGKRELGPGLLRAADRYVCDSLTQVEAMGELQHASGADRPRAIIELGRIAAGQVPGRRNADEVSICDLTGTGVQDTAIALAALTAAERLGLGARIG